MTSRKKRWYERDEQPKGQYKYGVKNPLEEHVALQIEKHCGDVRYEQERISYEKPCKYVPDFILPNGIFIEVKGYFQGSDRSKHLLVKQQNPDLDIRFVFNNAKSKLNKNSSTTYAMWCERNGFEWADKVIPLEWFEEPPNEYAIKRNFNLD